jgi:hypothetical protein
MTREQLNQLGWLEGRRVTLALRDGSRIDDSQLVSTGRASVQSLWLFVNGDDTFVPVDEVVDLWESQSVIG